MIIKAVKEQRDERKRRDKKKRKYYPKVLLNKKE